jgi:hypothetical protein
MEPYPGSKESTPPCRCGPHPSYNHLVIEGVVTSLPKAFGTRRLSVTFNLTTVESFRKGTEVETINVSHQIVCFDRVADRVKEIAHGDFLRVSGGLCYHDGRAQVKANSIVVLCHCLRAEVTVAARAVA